MDKHHQVRGIFTTNPATGGKDRFLIPGAGINVRAGIAYRFAAGSGGLNAASGGTGEIVEVARRAMR